MDSKVDELKRAYSLLDSFVSRTGGMSQKALDHAHLLASIASRAHEKDLKSWSEKLIEQIEKGNYENSMKIIEALKQKTAEMIKAAEFKNKESVSLPEMQLFELVRCRKCGVMIPSDSKFCGKCKAPHQKEQAHKSMLAKKKCFKCRKVIPSEFSFCCYCGEKQIG